MRGLRVFVVVGVLAALVASASATPVAAKQEQLTEDAWVSRTLARMSLAEKVGRLFVVNAYGQSVSDPEPQMVALNRQYYGVDTIEQLPAGSSTSTGRTISRTPRRSSRSRTGSSRSLSEGARPCRC